MMRSIAAQFGYALLYATLAGIGVAAAADGAASSPASARAPTDGVNGAALPAADSAAHRPPQEAFDACKSHSEGDACSVSFDGHTMNGTCRKGPNGESELACAPAHPPGPPPEGAPPQPPANSNSTLSSSALEHKLDRLEREIHGG